MRTGTGCWITALLALATAGGMVIADGEGSARMKAAQQYRAKNEAVTPAPDGTIICEAEEFAVTTPGWKAGAWGDNYYAATMANTFLSRKAFLGAPEDGEESVARIRVDVKEAGRYLVLVRYEAAYRFETQFRVIVTQAGRPVLDRLYGARDNLKIWAFKKKLQKEVAWPWGAVENIVWEGHDAYADLQPGTAEISLIAGRQPAPQARRNVDLVLLTRDEAQVKNRIDKEAYLPLDGWLTQAGDVWIRVRNEGRTNVTVATAGWSEHSPYYVHMRNWKPVSVTVGPGQSSDWTEVGSTMDSLNDGQWRFTSSVPCKIEFGVRNAAGAIEGVRTFESPGFLELAGPADARYSRRFQTRQEASAELIAFLKAIPMRGKTPVLTPIYAYSGVPEILPLFGVVMRDVNAAQAPGAESVDRVYLEWRGKDAAHLEEACAKLTPAERKNVLVVSLGDEIGLAAPAGTNVNEGFVAFLKAQGADPKELDPDSGGDWGRIAYNPKPDLMQAKPGLYYWSKRYQHAYGIQQQKKLTDVLRRNLPRARIGANYSPHGGGAHSYLGEVYQWVSCFREGGMTLPWGEDYIWQLPVGSPQMNGINLDLFRAGLRGTPTRDIMYYVMPHFPGNTPDMWRRLFVNAVGHGATFINLFEFDPVFAAYTENHVTNPEMYGMVLRTLRELGLYEDIVQAGRLRPAETALWFSETGDIWGDNGKSFGAAKRALYVAILGRQLPLDFVVDADAREGTLSRYKVLYLTDNHVSRASSRIIAEWVKNGGRLFATAGAGQFDEYDRPNAVLRELMGVEQTALDAPADAQVDFIKQDLPFVKVLDAVTLTGASNTLPVIGVRSRIKAAPDATVLGTFADRSPAVVSRKAGKGEVVACAFLPGLSWFKPAIPMRPPDRGSTDDAFTHFLPTAFDAAAGELIGSVAGGVVRPVLAGAPQVETTVIEAKDGVAITVNNWSGKPVKGLTLTASIPLPSQASLAGGGSVTVEKKDGRTTFVFDLEVADVLILRK